MELTLEYMSKIRAIKKRESDRRIREVSDQVKAEILSKMEPYVGTPNSPDNRAKAENSLKNLIDHGVATGELHPRILYSYY